MTDRHPARPTLELVAARAGVSRATASRVLRGAHNVSAAARDAVLRAADELSYSVNRAARSLVTRRSDTVAFVIAEDEDRTFHDPYFLRLLRGAQAESARAGRQLLVAMASSPAEAAQFVDYAAGGHVDGVLLTSVHGDDRLAERLHALGVPTVLNGRPADDSPVISVDADNTGGARDAVALLAAAGARRVATITGPLDLSAARDRLTGYRDGCRAAGLPEQDELVEEADFSLDGGAAAMARLLDADPVPDGVFAASDLTALGALRTLRARGRAVPGDVAVVGFDDIHEAELADPPLTTVRQPVADLGRTMTRLLLALIDGEPVPPRTVLPVQVVRRATA